MIENVAVVVEDGVESFGLGAFCEVFGEGEHPEDDVPVFDFAICTAEPGVVRGRLVDLHVHHGLDRLEQADLVAIAPRDSFESPTAPAVLDAVRRAHARGATILAACTAAFTLAEAGLLDGRRCTTHWRHAACLAETYPFALVEPDVLYVEQDGIVTGAGSAGALDAALHVVRREFGSRVAATFARRIVVPPHRDGGQAQYIHTPIVPTDADTLQPVLAWAVEHLEDEITVDSLAAEAAMSPRTFARRFRDETGTTPHQWLTRQRLTLAEELLETTPTPVEEVARRSGFPTAATLRHHFTRSRGTTPQAYRRAFGRVSA